MPAPIKKPTLPARVDETAQLNALLDDPQVVVEISKAYGSIERVLLQVQRYLVTEENRDSVGPTLLAMKNIDSFLIMFKNRGDEMIRLNAPKPENT